MALAGLTRATQVLRIYQLSKSSFSFLTKKSIKNSPPSLSSHVQCTHHYCTVKKPAIPGKSAAPHATEEMKKLKGMKSPQITLIISENEVKATSLENAQKLAKRRDLKLVKIIDFDTKTERPVFKLMTGSEFFEEDAKSKDRKKKEKESAVKDDKLFLLSTKIGDNDLSIKIKQMSKALTKKHPVRVYISQDGNSSRVEEIVKIIEEELIDLYSSKKNTRKHTTVKLNLNPKVENENVDANKKEEIESDKVKVKVK